MKLIHSPLNVKRQIKAPGSASLVVGLASLLLLPSCSDIVFATRTSVGVEVAGDATQAPDHVTFGFRRRELIYAGKDAPKNQSLLGKLDAETTWTKGAAVRETFATGSAAEAIAAGKEPGPSEHVETAKHPLTFASRTRIGFGINVGTSEDNSAPSGYFGYSRRIATRIKTEPDSNGGPGHIPSLVGDVTVHTSGMLGTQQDATDPGQILHEDQRLTDGTGIGRARIRQLFAVGRGTAAIGASQAKELQQQLSPEPQ